MPTCRSCGAHVTQEAIRVMYPDDTTEPQSCIRCPDVGKIGFDSRRVDE